jgi:lipoprotein-releasing system permease protein
VQKLDEADVGRPPPNTKRLSEELERLLNDEEDAEEKAPPATLGPTLPGIVVGQELARSLRLYLGDEVNVVTPLGELGPTGPMPKSRPFRVAGIFYSGMYEYDMKFAYVTLASAQKFLGTGDRASGIEITVREPDRAQEVATLVGQKLGAQKLRVRPWQELNKNLFGALALEKLAMFIALGIAILVASFCIVGTLTLMVQEKGREVAVLKALGAGDRAIVGIFVLEGTLIGVFGSMLGLALGYVVCFAAERFGVRLNPEVYYIDRLPVHIDPFEFISVGLAAVAVCLFVTIYPAKLASRLRPVDALRYE